VDELTREGARPMNNAKDVAEHSDIVVTVLPDSPDVELVYAGAQGISSGANLDRYWLICRAFPPGRAQTRRGSGTTRLRYAGRAVSGGELEPSAPRSRS
jgi:2-hydroxy-3-oxopropionate reductase